MEALHFWFFRQSTTNDTMANNNDKNSADDVDAEDDESHKLFGAENGYLVVGGEVMMEDGVEAIIETSEQIGKKEDVVAAAVSDEKKRINDGLDKGRAPKRRKRVILPNSKDRKILTLCQRGKLARCMRQIVLLSSAMATSKVMEFVMRCFEIQEKAMYGVVKGGDPIYPESHPFLNSHVDKIYGWVKVFLSTIGCVAAKMRLVTVRQYLLADLEGVVLE